MTLHLKRLNINMQTIVSTYAPTLYSEEDTKDNCYSQLNHILQNTPKTDKLILLGDFNARVGRDQQMQNGVIGEEGIGQMPEWPDDPLLGWDGQNGKKGI